MPDEPFVPADAERALIENLTPGHMTPHDFYDHCQRLAERSGRDAYGVARGYALGVIFSRCPKCNRLNVSGQTCPCGEPT